MINTHLFRLSILICTFSAVSLNVFSQSKPSPWIKSQEVSEQDGIPVLVKHLPDWEILLSHVVFTQNVDDLKKTLGERPILDLIDFTGGTEAVIAPYPVGKLLIIEYTNPQASANADRRFVQRLAESQHGPPIVYRRIGNYNAFVFDAADQEAANLLLDQIKYQKTVQWLGEDPYLLKRFERYFITTTRDIFIATVVWIVSGIGLSVVLGLIAGFTFFRFRENQRANRTAYSDAGGLTRLNLDGLSE